jgi:hypothetical protein
MKIICNDRGCTIGVFEKGRYIELDDTDGILYCDDNPVAVVRNVKIKISTDD